MIDLRKSYSPFVPVVHPADMILQGIRMRRPVVTVRTAVPLLGVVRFDMFLEQVVLRVRPWTEFALERKLRGVLVCDVGHQVGPMLEVLSTDLTNGRLTAGRVVFLVLVGPERVFEAVLLTAHVAAVA